LKTIWQIDSVDSDQDKLVQKYLSEGWEPFSVVSTPVVLTTREYFGDGRRSDGEQDIIGSYKNVIWFRRLG
jgi:hypothetical protein